MWAYSTLFPTGLSFARLVQDTCVQVLQPEQETSYAGIVCSTLGDGRRWFFMAAATLFLESVFWSSIFYYSFAIGRLNLFGLQRYRIPTKKNGEREGFSSEDWSKALNHVFENNFISR